MSTVIWSETGVAYPSYRSISRIIERARVEVIQYAEMLSV